MNDTPWLDRIESMRALERGDIPTRARRRLSAHRDAQQPFSSGLSVSETLLTTELGARPIAQVMGSSIYHIGRIPDYKGTTGEIVTISDAHREARRLALRRLWEEANVVGADAVIGVHLRERLITKGAHGKGGDDGDEVIEFTVTGTAIAMAQLRQPSGAVVTDLSGQDLWALLNDGFVPCGIVFDYCRYHVFHVLDPNSYQAQKEIGAAADGVRAAQRLVEQRVLEQARVAGGQLVVGADLQLRVHEVPCGWEGCAVNDLDIDIMWFGTAVRRDARVATQTRHDVPPLILGMMPLGRKQRGEVVAGEEDESAELERQGREEEERAAETAAERSEGGGE
jgi:uncharacterized protein YbjQ (UPF0145 family)